MPPTAEPATSASASSQSRIHRFEVRPKAGVPDPIAAAVARDAAALGLPVAGVDAAHVYLLAADAGVQLDDAALDRLGASLLADPVTEVVVRGAAPAAAGASLVEVHPLPGVMDPVAHSLQRAVRELTGVEVEATTGWRYDLHGVTPQHAADLARRLLANPVIHRVMDRPYWPARMPAGVSHEGAVASVRITHLTEAELLPFSRQAHLFLSAAEMQAIQAHYRSLGREPTEVELETLAQTWSEHCVHKTLKSRVRYVSSLGPQDVVARPGRPGHTLAPDGSVAIANLLKSTVAAATFDLIRQGLDWTLSVFTDNSGVIAFDDAHGVCIKVETHNRPSAIEPYGGAATGIGGCIRDVIATGLGSLPFANTDVFCVAHPTGWTDAGAGGERPLPHGVLHPRRILSQVVAGVRDYGNRMGIPTVNGAVWFDDRHIGNPLVFCGCLGLIPRGMVKGEVRPGDRIVCLGGRTGRDGIHGATFSSGAIESSAADEFSHAVQIGNAITEKQVLDAVLRARDADPAGPLYHAMTDCGAGGFSSAIGEMGKDLGAEVHLERAPLKYPGLSATEIWISEAQERLVLAVPPHNLARLREICDEESVEIADLGHFGTPAADLVLNFRGKEVGRLSMHFLHEGIPMPTQEAVWNPAPPSPKEAAPRPLHLKDALWALLAHPNIASKHWVVRQYDHEVRGNTVVKPLVGPQQRGPADASVLEPVPGSGRGVAIACGLATPLGDVALGGDPYQAALGGIDEAVRNLVCVGADPDRIAILDNFCWPSCQKPANMGALVRACAGCYDGAMAYRTPFVSGKDSLNNQFVAQDGRVIEIPFTLLITGVGIVPEIEACITSDAKRPGHRLLLVGRTDARTGASHLRALGFAAGDPAVPTVDLAAGPAAARAVHAAVRQGHVHAAHDCSEGGLLVAVAEMLMGACSPGRPIGARLDLGPVHADPGVAAFAETPGRYVLEVAPEAESAVLAGFARAGVPAVTIGELDSSGVLTAPEAGLSAVVGDLLGIWSAPLDW